MKQQISFVYNGVQYFTFDGSNYLTSSLKTNAATMQELSAKNSFQTEMRKLNNGSPRYSTEFPAVMNAKVSKDGNFYVVSGTVMINGNSVEVKLDKDGLHYPEETDKKAEPVVEQKKAEPTQEKTAEPAPEPVVEKKAEPAPAVEKKAEPVQEPVSEKNVEPAPELIVVKKEQVAAKNPVPKQTVVQQRNSNDTEIVGGFFMGKDCTKKYASKKKLNHGMPAGFTFGNRQNKAPLKVVLGNPNPTDGFTFGGATTMQAQRVNQRPVARGTQRLVNNSARAAMQRAKTNATVQPARAVVPQPQPQPAVVQQRPVAQTYVSEPVKEVAVEVPVVTQEESDRLMTSWQAAAPIGERKFAPAPEQSVEELVAETRKEYGVEPEPTEEQRKTPLPLVGEAVIETPTARDRDAAKLEARQSFSKEVNEVIGDIPTEMLGQIVEFTTNPVDVVSLNSIGDMFCIDNRWHKQGKWYCIDVVPNASRYFFNSKRGVSIEISVRDLKKWEDALK